MSADFEVLFGQIVSERGGKTALGIVGMSIARSLAAALCDATTPPSVVANLSASLPAPMQPGEQTFDVKELTTSELRQLEYLLGRAAGLKEPKPPRVRRSAREERGLELAQYLDRIARRDGTPTSDEEIEIRNRIFYVLGDVADASQIYSYLAAPTAVAAPQTTATPEPESSSAPANVVDLRPPGIHGAAAPLARHDGVWRGHEL
jgi:hypothetical protein